MAWLLQFPGHGCQGEHRDQEQVCCAVAVSLETGEPGLCRTEKAERIAWCADDLGHADDHGYGSGNCQDCD